MFHHVLLATVMNKREPPSKEMTVNRTRCLHDLGQSLWLDNITRELWKSLMAAIESKGKQVR